MADVRRTFLCAMVMLVVIVGLGTASAQDRIIATSKDGVRVALDGALVTQAYETLCRTQTDPPCDRLEKYFVNVSVAEQYFGAMFMHRSVDASVVDTRHLTTFVCERRSGEGYDCFSFGMQVEELPEISGPTPEIPAPAR